MTYKKNLLSMPSLLHSPASWQETNTAMELIRMIVADRHEQVFFTRNESRYQCDISREVSVPGSGELIVDLRNSVSDRWKLRNFGLSTDVDKAVRNSNLNYDFRLPTLGDKIRREGVTNERCVAKGR